MPSLLKGMRRGPALTTFTDIRVDSLFREAGVVVAFPQRDVHLDSQRPIQVELLQQPVPGTTADSKARATEDEPARKDAEAPGRSAQS